MKYVEVPNWIQEIKYESKNLFQIMLVVLFPQQNRCCPIQCTFPVSPGKNMRIGGAVENLASAEMHCLLVNCSLVSARGHFFILTLMAAAQCQVFHIAMLQWRAFSVGLTLTVQDLKMKIFAAILWRF